MEIFRKIGPYLVVEILLPGGTLLAVLLYCTAAEFFRARCPSGARPFDYRV